MNHQHTPGECPGCGTISQPPITPPGWERPWWCRACLQTKCTAAWQATATYSERTLVEATF